MPANPASRDRLSLFAAAALAWSVFAEPALAEEQKGADDPRAALEQQRQQFAAAISRADAAGVAACFTSDAKLMVADFDAITGRGAIQQVWQFVLGSGAVARLVLEPKELDGLDGDLPVETGTLVSFDRAGKAGSRDNYLLIWKREGGAWKIYRDIVSPGVPAAPTVDRVGFPRDYRTQLTRLTGPTFNPKLGVVQTAYGNEPATQTATTGKPPYPHGSVLVMEFSQAVKDGAGNPVLDPDGHAQRGPVFRVDVMRREAGFGEAYGKNRAGEWEFVSYKPDGSHLTPPAGTASCAACHLNQAGPAKDFVFTHVPTAGKSNP